MAIGKGAEQRLVDTMITGALVLPMTKGVPLIEDGAVAVDGGRIVAVGPTDDLRSRYRGRQEVDGRKRAILPGFVNTHFHFTQNFLKGSRDDVSLLDWINQVSFPRILEVVGQYRRREALYHHYSVLQGGIDLLRSGITCSVNMEWAMLPDIVDSYEQVGIRAVNTLTLTDVTSWTPEDAVLSHDEYFGLAGELISRCRESKDGRVGFAYGVACPNSNTKELMVRARQHATDDQVPLHIHLAETRYEFDRFMEEQGQTPTAFLESLGFWDRDVWAAHSIWLTEQDQDILARYGVGVAHNPKCNMKISSGAAPVRDMLRRGIAVGLGVDSCAVSDNTDFFETMRTAVFLQRVTTMDPEAILGFEALDMATAMGAKAMKMDDRIGTLEEGKLADLIVVDLTAVNIRPFNNLVNNLVFAANSSNIRSVMVGGEWLIENGKFVRFDEEAMLDEAEGYIAQLLKEKGLDVPSYFAIAQQGKETDQ